jgi:hypothetical protein
MGWVLSIAPKSIFELASASENSHQLLQSYMIYLI